MSVTVIPSAPTPVPVSMAGTRSGRAAAPARRLHHRLCRLRAPADVGVRRLRGLVHRRSPTRGRHRGRRRRGPGRAAARAGRAGPRGPALPPGRLTHSGPIRAEAVPEPGAAWTAPEPQCACPVRPWGVPRSAPSDAGTGPLRRSMAAPDGLGVDAGRPRTRIGSGRRRRHHGHGVRGDPGRPARSEDAVASSGTMQFTYRNPERSTDPTRILPGARSLVVGALSYRHQERQDRPRLPGPAVDAGATRPVQPGVVARYARSDHYASLRGALEPIAAHLRAGGWRATVVCDDNALVDRAAAHRAGLGWFGKNSLLLLPGLGSWFVLGTVVTDAAAPPDGPRGSAGPRAGLRDVLPLPGRLPDRRAGRARGARRPPLPGLVGAGDRLLPRAVPAGPGGPDLRVRRVPAGLPHQPAGRPEETRPRRRTATAAGGSTSSTCSGPPTRSCWPPTGVGTSPIGTPGTCAATRWWPWATWATGATRTSEHALRRWLAGRRPDAGRARRVGGPASWAGPS